MNELVRMPPKAFVRFLRELGISRFYLVTDPMTGQVRPSHRELEGLADFLRADRRDMMGHEGVFVQVGRDAEVLHGAFVHWTHRGQAQGGTRFWGYDSVEGFLRDGLRLSKGMTRKNALAGLWWGGGKGVIARDPEAALPEASRRARIFEEYGEFVSSLKGCYVTAEDVGTGPDDVAAIFRKTRFVTCVPQACGGSGNPSSATARGVIRGMEAALRFLDGGALEGRRIAVQGMGNVGGPLISMLLERRGNHVVATDIDPARVDAMKKKHPGRLDVRVAAKGDDAVLLEECDVLAPCATGAIINERTIPRLRCKVVCGAANNQLEDPARDDALLTARGILYVPDFLCNRMGIVQCANEQYGYVDPDPAVDRHLGTEWEHSIHRMTIEVLETARRTGVPPARTADALADRLAQSPHPIFGHRGAQIVTSLVKSGWEKSAR